MALSPNQVITPQTSVVAPLSLAAVTACTTRAPTLVSGAAAANIFQIAGTVTTNGMRLDRIYVKGVSSSFTAATVAQTVTIWYSDGTTLWPIDENLVSAVTPSTTVASFQIFQNYTLLNIPSTGSVWASTSITTTAATTALDVVATGAAY